uniref:HYR domain-containing protein n=1 Tax=Chromera velia CCMP2878 TaxID=1169474 RepID=A0A0K6SBA2_9ALVE|eukprot:Cvel_13402.t2-p1 / transcript=Cvel_13402.t2 / gene=Cvel_13402 / organism=Chromera_velia_CCMP2878 / gene_product=hypothetical protein / transcript_product=hypothetical protein / location=Cvel_scaffold913:38801-50734(+) / protein_length=1331 / sequence_SO=supercontig / SO=protein_coding / is_pseudo=false
MAGQTQTLQVPFTQWGDEGIQTDIGLGDVIVRITRMWDVSDAAGNSAQYSQVVEVLNDVADPFPQTVPNLRDGQMVFCGAPPPEPFLELSYDFDSALSSVSSVGGTFTFEYCSLNIPLGTTTTDECTYDPSTGILSVPTSVDEARAVFTYQDQCGDAILFSNVIVFDREDPVAFCPQALITLHADENCEAVVDIPCRLQEVSFFWNGGMGTVVSVLQSLKMFPKGATDVVFTAFDTSNQTGSCNVTVLVKDKTVPTISCQESVTVDADPTTCTANVMPTGTASDNCDGDLSGALVFSPPGPSFPLGQTRITASVTDAAGGSSSCSFDVTVVDVTSPVLSCPADATLEAGPGCAATHAWTAATVVDACGSASVIQTSGRPNGSTFPLGEHFITYAAIDSAGNSASCTFKVTVVDTTAPVFGASSCLQMTLSADVNQCGKFLQIEPDVTDNCPLTTKVAPNTFFNLGTTQVTETATDSSGNTASCDWAMIVNDDTDPTSAFPEDLEKKTETGSCLSNVRFATTSDDNCPDVSQNFRPFQSSFDASFLSNGFPPGVYTIEKFVEDASGNLVTGTFQLTVSDMEKPTITCPADIEVETDPGLCSAVVTYDDPVVTDNCGATGSLQSGLPSGGSFPLGVTVVEWQATENTGMLLTETCSFTVTVKDRELPMPACPADISMEVVTSTPEQCATAVSFGAEASSDNCGIASASYLPNEATNFTLGQTIVTKVVIDDNGNVNRCTFTVTITDTTPPTIVCPPDVTVNNTEEVCAAYDVMYEDPVVTDNCPENVIVIASNPSGATYPVGTTPVTLTATDRSGLTSDCTFNVTVEDTECPKVPFSSDTMFSFKTEPGEETAEVEIKEIKYIDNCPVDEVRAQLPQPAISGNFSVGITNVTYEICDAAGNCKNVTIMIDVFGVDCFLPVCKDANNILVFVPKTVTEAVVPFEVPQCEAPMRPEHGPALPIQDRGIIQGPKNSPGTFPLGTSSVVFQATNECGTTTSTFTVVVVEQKQPEENCEVLDKDISKRRLQIMSPDSLSLFRMPDMMPGGLFSGLFGGQPSESADTDDQPSETVGVLTDKKKTSPAERRRQIATDYNLQPGTPTTVIVFTEELKFEEEYGTTETKKGNAILPLCSYHLNVSSASPDAQVEALQFVGSAGGLKTPTEAKAAGEEAASGGFPMGGMNLGGLGLNMDGLFSGFSQPSGVLGGQQERDTDGEFFGLPLGKLKEKQRLGLEDLKGFPLGGGGEEILLPGNVDLKGVDLGHLGGLGKGMENLGEAIQHTHMHWPEDVEGRRLPVEGLTRVGREEAGRLPREPVKLGLGEEGADPAPQAAMLQLW